LTFALRVDLIASLTFALRLTLEASWIFRVRLLSWQPPFFDA